MSGLEVIGSIASVVQLAGAVYSISIQLYEVANALSNAPADIKDLAHDLEIFSEELLLHSKLVNANNSRYSDQINRLTAKIIGRCAIICEKIDKILKKLRSGSVLARLKWMYKEKEIRKLLGRLRDLKLSLMGTLSLLRTLKADHMMDALGVQAPSLLGGPQDEKLSRETMEEVENTRRKLGSITMDKCKPPSLSETTLTTQASWNPREIDETTGEKAQQGEGDSQSFRPMSLKPGAVSRAVQQASTIPLISAVALPGINTIMQNLGALESVQSFHSAVSHQENPFENDQDAIRGLQSAESQAIPSNYLAAEGPSPTSAAMGTPHSIHGATVPVPVWPSQDASSKAYSASQDAYEEDVTLNSDCYRSWQKDVAEASARHFNMDPKDAESLACLIQMPRIKTAQVTYVDPATQWSPCIGPIRYLQSLSGQREHGGRTNSDEPQTNGPRISYPSGEMYIQGAQGAESISSAEGRHPTHRHSKHRSEALPILRPTRTHRKERIVIVDSPPTPRTPQATSPGPEMQILNGQPSHPLQQTQSGQHRESLSSPSMYFHRWQPPKTQSSTGSVNQPPPGMRYGRQGTPETGLESPGMRVVLSNYVTETGPSAITSAMRPPHSIHGHINPVPEWAPQGLGLNPRIVTYDNYGPGTECTYQAQGMDDFASEFTAPRPNGFVDPLILHPQYTDRPNSATQSNETSIYPPPTYPASPSLSMSRSPRPVKQGSQSPYLSSYGGSSYPYPPPRRPSLATHQSYSSQDGFSSEESKEKGRCTYPECGKVFKDLKAHMLTHQNSDPVKSLKQTHSKDDFSTNDNAVESVLRGLWNVHDGLSVANRATEPPVVSRPLGKNSNFVSFAQEPQISPKLTRLPEIRTPEVLEKPLADFVVKLHDYQQSWEGSGERQCPGPRDHPGLGDQDSMSQRPPASRPASRSPPNGQRIILPPVQHVRSSQVAPPGEDWRSLGVHSILNPIHLRDDGQQDSRLPLPVGSPESSPKPSEFELDMRGKKIATTQSEDPCENSRKYHSSSPKVSAESINSQSSLKYQKTNSNFNSASLATQKPQDLPNFPPSSLPGQPISVHTPPKRMSIACVTCRKRKLKCDGSKPICSTCMRLGRSCVYDEVRAKSRPNRGDLKSLEERYGPVETLLRTNVPAVTIPEGMTASNWLSNGQLTPTSSTSAHYHRESSLSSFGSAGLASSFAANTSNLHVSGDLYNEFHDFQHHSSKPLTPAHTSSQEHFLTPQYSNFYHSSNLAYTMGGHDGLPKQTGNAELMPAPEFIHSGRPSIASVASRDSPAMPPSYEVERQMKGFGATMPGLPPPPLHPLASVSSSPTNLPRRHTSADIRNVQGWQANASLSRQGQHPVPNREGTGQGKAMRPASRSFGGPMPQQPPQLRHSGRNLQMQQSLQYPVMQGMGQGYHAPGRGLYQPDQGVQQFMQPNTSGPQPGAQGWAGKQPPGSAGTWWTGQPVNINGSEPGAQGRVGGHVPQNSSPFQGERTNGTSEKAGSSTYSFTKGDPLSEIDDVLRLPGDKGQLWWRAFTKLRKEISGTRLHEARIEAHHLKENAREDTIAHNAINNLIIALEKTKADILKELITAVPESIVQILDIAKVVQSTLDFKTGGFIWTCLSSVISTCLNDRSNGRREALQALSHLAEITTLVARYNVMESIYHQWPGMTVDKGYENSLINLCVEVLRYLNAVYLQEYYDMGNFSTVSLETMMQHINKADADCRGFSVTIVQDVLQRTLDELEEDDSDSDSDDTVEIKCGVKRRIEDVSDKEDDSDGTAVGTHDITAVKELPSVKRVKV